MTRTRFLAALAGGLLTVVGHVPAASAAPAIAWVTNFEEGMRQARERSQPVLLEFWANWCAPCIEMDRTVYIHPEVVALSRRFVNIRVDFDLDRSTVAKYDVYGIPNIVFLDPWGQVLTRRLGLARTEKMIEVMKAMPESFAELAPTAEVLGRNPQDLGALIAATRFYQRRGLLEAARDLLARADKTPAAAAPGGRDELRFARGSYLVAARDYGKAEKTFREALAEAEPSGRPFMLYGLALVQAKRGRAEEARRLATQILDQHAASPAAPHARQLIESLGAGPR